MRILIAGATGGLGRGVIPLLVQRGHQVSAVGRTAEKRSLLATLGAQPIDTDLYDLDQVRRAIAGTEVPVSIVIKGAPPNATGILRIGSQLIVDTGMT